MPIPCVHRPVTQKMSEEDSEDNLYPSRFTGRTASGMVKEMLNSRSSQYVSQGDSDGDSGRGSILTSETTDMIILEEAIAVSKSKKMKSSTLPRGLPPQESNCPSSEGFYGQCKDASSPALSRSSESSPEDCCSIMLSPTHSPLAQKSKSDHSQSCMSRSYTALSSNESKPNTTKGNKFTFHRKKVKREPTITPPSPTSPTSRDSKLKRTENTRIPYKSGRKRKPKDEVQPTIPESSYSFQVSVVKVIFGGTLRMEVPCRGRHV